MFSFLFSFWGNHELGDGARIPIGYEKDISNTNGAEYAHIKGIQSQDGNDIYTTKFKIYGNEVCGNYESDFFDYSNAYFIYHLETDLLIEFRTENEYNIYALKNELPKTNEFLSFDDNYENYWFGWRFWLLA